MRPDVEIKRCTIFYKVAQKVDTAVLSLNSLLVTLLVRKIADSNFYSFCKLRYFALLNPSYYWLDSTWVGSKDELPLNKCLWQRTLTIGGRNTVFLVSSFTSTLHTNDNTFSFLIKSNLVKFEASRTVILPQTLSVL